MKQGELQKANKIFKELQLIYLEKFKFYENNLNENLRLKLYYELLNVNMALFEIKNWFKLKEILQLHLTIGIS